MFSFSNIMIWNRNVISQVSIYYLAGTPCINHNLKQNQHQLIESSEKIKRRIFWRNCSSSRPSHNNPRNSSLSTLTAHATKSTDQSVYSNIIWVGSSNLDLISILSNIPPSPLEIELLSTGKIVCSTFNIVCFFNLFGF